MKCEGYGMMEGCDGEGIHPVCLDDNMETDMCDSCIAAIRESGEMSIEVLDEEE